MPPLIAIRFSKAYTFIDKDSVVLNSHTHPGDSGGTTGQPNKGAALMRAGAPAVDEDYAMQHLAGCLGDSLTETDKRLLCIPKVAKAMEANAPNEDDAKGWEHLRKMMTRWLTSPVNRNAKADMNPYWVDWKWALALPATSWAESPEHIYRLFTRHPFEGWGRNIYNKAAQYRLGQILGDGGELSTGGRKPFNHIDMPWYHREGKHYTSRPVPGGYSIDGRQATLGSFTLRALAKGWTEPNPDGEGHIVYVEGCSVFIYDLFNFAIDENSILKDQYLGFWDCEGRNVSYTPGWNTYLLANSNFISFQDRHNMGGDFIVLSDRHSVENFKKFPFPHHCCPAKG